MFQKGHTGGGGRIKELEMHLFYYSQTTFSSSNNAAPKLNAPRCKSFNVFLFSLRKMIVLVSKSPVHFSQTPKTSWLPTTTKVNAFKPKSWRAEMKVKIYCKAKLSTCQNRNRNSNTTVAFTFFH